ncbi:hypothetical protein E0493_20305 [Roseomonas sp. M0104]|uniref:DUF2946 domain-containing protein n=1 Tax=Teichococcus coralli TaxID=2545983 RepID=A0A845BHR9_9PROT|nr:DUF2946 family protein [Pseudoroseomonas coralli]MXP65696.1 hypothetical protein [Pseudoroseomonas coralli]
MIVRLRALLVSLFAVLLLGQSAAAAAHCLWQARRLAAPGELAVPICTPDGLRQAHGTGGPDAPPGPAEPCVCIVCHALPQAGLPHPPTLPEPAWRLALHSAPPPLPPRPAARAPPGMPRGPPLG